MRIGDHWRHRGEYGRSLKTWRRAYEFTGDSEVSIGDHWRVRCFDEDKIT